MVSPTLAQIQGRFSRPASPPVQPPELLPAAVLVPLFLVAEEPHILFTQRTFTVRDHQGQISFPGGVRDPGDPDLLATALRETAEEIGLQPEAVQILGSLEPVATVTGYWINPFVALIPHPYDFRPNPLEVRRLLVFALREFFSPARWSTGNYHFRGAAIRVCCWRQGKTVIWGATARMLLDFLSRLDVQPLGEWPEKTCLD